MEVQQFSQVLLQTLSAEKEPRDQAQSILEQLLKTQPDLICNLLTQCQCAGDDLATEVRQTACVLFRRYCHYISEPKLSLWSNISATTKAQCQAALLAAMIRETNKLVRYSLKDVIVMLANNISETVKDPAAHFWPELLVGLWQCAQHESPVLREIALLILSEIPEVFGEQLDRYLGEIQQLLQQSLSQQVPIEVQVAACKALTGFTTVIRTDAQRQYFAPLLQCVIQVIMAACSNNNESSAQSGLESLIELAELEPKFFRSAMPLVIESLTQIGSAKTLDDGTRRLAIEVLLELCEEAAPMVRKYPALVEKLVPLFLEMCMEFEDDEEWSKIDDDDIGDEESNCTFGEQSLDRLAIAMGGKAVLPIAFNFLPKMLVDMDSWQQRAAALTAIAAIAEGCSIEMQPSLDDIMKFVTPRLTDPHPRVRYTACNAVGQLSIDFAAPVGKENNVCFQTLFHAQVIPALLTMMKDVDNCRVQAHGAAALVNFCEHASGATLAPHLNDILSRLAEMLQSSYRIVLEQTVTALATVADSSKKYFQQYYSHFMPFLKKILKAPPQDEKWRLLRGKTMECITLIGVAVQKEVFFNDAREVMEELNTSTQNMHPDDPQISYILAAWARICEVLGDDFVPYLQVVMPPLLRSIKLEPEMQVLDVGQSEDTLQGGSENWDVMPISEDRSIGIKTSVLDEKKTACEMLRIYVQQMKGSFKPYIVEVSNICEGLLKFVFDEDIRSTTASILPLLLRAIVAADVAPQESWAKFSGWLIEAIQFEIEREVISWQLEALKDCIDILVEADGAQFITQEYLAAVGKMVNGILAEYSDTCESRKRRRLEDEDYDDVAETQLQEEELLEVQVLKEISGLMHSLFNALGKDFAPTFQLLINEFAGMLEPEPARSYTDHQWALCVFDDFIETCGPESFPFAQLFVPSMLLYSRDKHPDVAQAAAYGLGVMAMHGGPNYAPVCKEALTNLMAVVNDKKARTFGHIGATENALSAIIKIIRMPEVGVSLEESLPGILKLLPITEDDDEAEYVYTFLCDLLQQRNPVIFQPECLLRVFEIFGMVIDTDVAPVYDDSRSTPGSNLSVGMRILHTIQSMDETTLQEIVSRLPDEPKARLSHAMAPTPAP
eukprot:m.201493 g.201493  ORF g.201493 m.201493 type:complete len:1122 (-) comp32797_c1_seq1:134-3499(-)